MIPDRNQSVQNVFCQVVATDEWARDGSRPTIPPPQCGSTRSSTAPPPNCYDYIYLSLSPGLDLIGFRVEQPKTALVVSSYLNSPEICPLHKYFGFKWCSAKRVIRSFQIILAFPTSETGTQPKSYLSLVAKQIGRIASDYA